MELTQLFEQISGSDEFKEEYDRLEKEKKKCARARAFCPRRTGPSLSRGPCLCARASGLARPRRGAPGATEPRPLCARPAPHRRGRLGAPTRAQRARARAAEWPFSLALAVLIARAHRTSRGNRARNAADAPEVEEDIDELAAAAEAQKTKDKELGRSRSIKMPNCGNSGATYDLREGVLVQGLEIKGSSACTAAFDEDDDGTSYLTLTVRARAPASHARASHA